MPNQSINKGTRVTVTLGMILFGVFFAVAYFWNDIQAEAKVIQADLKSHKASAEKGFEKLAEASAEEIDKLIAKSDQKFTEVMAAMTEQLLQNARTLAMMEAVEYHIKIDDTITSPADVREAMRD